MSEQHVDANEQIVDLLLTVQKAQQDEIVSRAQIDINRDNLLEVSASYPSILAAEALRLGERMLYLHRHPYRARLLGKTMCAPSSIAWEVRQQTDPDGSLRIVSKAIEKQQKRRSARTTDVWTPLMFASGAEDISDGLHEGRYVHGWYFRVWARGGIDPKNHLIDTVTIFDSHQDVLSGEKRDTRAHIVSIVRKQEATIAELYIKYPPFKSFPPDNRERLPEDYLLPIGLLRQASKALGRTKRS